MRKLLARRVRHSLRSFQFPADEPGGELYLFVMEDPQKQRIVGTSCIVSKVGGFQPFYAYRIQSISHTSKTLDIQKTVPTLTLETQHSGPCEIGGLVSGSRIQETRKRQAAFTLSVSLHRRVP